MASLSQKIVEVLFRVKDEASKKVASIEKSFKKSFDSLLSFANLSLLGIATGIATAITRMSSLESKMTDIANLFNATKNQTKELTDQIVELSRETGISSKDLANAEFDIVSAGIKVSESMNVLAASSKLAVAGFTSAEIATTFVPSVP